LTGAPVRIIFRTISHNHMEVARAADRGGVLASTNHHQFLDRKLSGGADPITEPLIAGSFARLARMWELQPGWKPGTRNSRIDVFRRPGATRASDWMRSIGLNALWSLDRLMASAIVKED
jgi:hypothetical protein